MLVLTARSEGRNDRHARIGVFQNGGNAGVLTVDAEHEAGVLAWINVHTELLEACKAAASALAGAVCSDLDHDEAEETLRTVRAAIATTQEIT